MPSAPEHSLGSDMPYLFDLCAGLYGSAFAAALFCAYPLNTEG